MRMGFEWGAMLVAVAVTAGATGAVVTAQAPAPKTYTATATVKTAGGATISAPVTVTISRWTTDAERTTALAALKKGDAALKGGVGRNAGDRDDPGRRTIYAVALRPHAGHRRRHPGHRPRDAADCVSRRRRAGAEGQDRVMNSRSRPSRSMRKGKGTAGDLAPAAKVKLGPGDAVVVDDYGVEAVRLTAISAK